MKLDESVLDRRDFLDGLIGAGMLAGGAVAADVVLHYLTGIQVPEPDQIVVAGQALQTLARERFVLVAYGPSPVMLFQLPDAQIRALSAVCTHGQCNVRYRPASNDIYCGCHQGRYTTDGVNVPGTPPPRRLAPFHVRPQADGTLIVSKRPFDAPPASGPSSESTPTTKG
jgi:nitrite reductase/ring-hydroxylating ferredoxin subunit